MLKSLYISSFVIIDKMHIDFYEGMSVLTGETGAGKSIIIDALLQLCGQRSSTSLIKKGATKAVIEAIFDVTITPHIEKIMNELHLDIDEQIVISKEILSSGKSNVKINYQNASNSALKMLVPCFLDIHSQFETQKLFSEKNHIHLLDEYSQEKLKPLYKEYHSLYNEYLELTRHLEDTINEDMSDEQLDYLLAQASEIDEVDYTDEEIEEFEEELKMMQNYEKMNEDIQHFDQLFSSSQGALPKIKEALSYLDKLTEYTEFVDSYNQIYNEYYNLIDQYESIMDSYRNFQFDEYRFQELQDLLFQVNRLKRKYGFTMTRIKEYRDELQNNIEKIKNRESYIHDLQEKVDNAKQLCLNCATQMHNIRKEYAKKFEKKIEEELKGLYLKNAIFKVDIKESHLNRNGIDQVCFMVSMNKGQDLSLLNESASGGEISRLMLAIKTVILHYNNIETVIFDEVDTGVSGKVASSIGDKMQRLSSIKQVLCITHLPQVARYANHHYSIEKTSDQEHVSTLITLLNEEQRVYEIAKMLSGEKMTEEAIDNAKKLLYE